MGRGTPASFGADQQKIVRAMALESIWVGSNIKKNCYIHMQERKASNGVCVNAHLEMRDTVGTLESEPQRSRK